MEIALHLGVHCTDDGRLVRSLLRSRATLLPLGIAVPPPRRYRSLLRESLNILAGARANREVEGLLTDTLTDDETTRRLVLFHESLICIPLRALSDEGLYPMAPRRFAAFRNLFPTHDLEFHLALCNPATLVPTLALRAGPDGYEALTDGVRVQRLRWLPTIRAILAANPGINLTLWCNEDTPLFWPDVQRALTATAPELALEGDLDLLAALLDTEGFARLTDDLATLDFTAVQDRRDAITRALEDHARPEEMEIEIALPGWTEDLVNTLTAHYETDCAAIAELPGVRFLAP